MRIRVLRTDGTSDKVRSSSFGAALKAGDIAAFLCSEGWVVVKGTRNLGMNGGAKKRRRLIAAIEKT